MLRSFFGGSNASSRDKDNQAARSPERPPKAKSPQVEIEEHDENSQRSGSASQSSRRQQNVAIMTATRSAPTVDQTTPRKAPSSKAKPSTNKQAPAPGKAPQSAPVSKTTSRKSTVPRKILSVPAVEEVRPAAAKSKKRKAAEVEAQSDDEEAEEVEISDGDEETQQTALDEPQSIKVQLKSLNRGQEGEILELNVGDDVLINGIANDKNRVNGYDRQLDMPYWIGTILRIHRSKPKKKDDKQYEGELDQGARVDVRWYFNVEELKYWGLNPPEIQMECASFGEKEIIWSDYTQSKPQIPVQAICGKCLILKYDDKAEIGSRFLNKIDETAADLNTQPVDNQEGRPATHEEALVTGAGQWAADDHIFYYRSELHGLGKNWKKGLARFNTQTLNKSGSRPYRLHRDCTCKKPYSPSDIMRYCESDTCKGKWYHMSCIVAAQETLNKDDDSRRISGFTANKPARIPNELWENAISPIVRGGVEGLVGNWPIVSATRNLVRRFLEGETEVRKQIRSWEEMVNMPDYELATSNEPQRFAGRTTQANEDEILTPNDIYCPGCGVPI